MLPLLLISAALAQEPCVAGADLPQLRQAMRAGLLRGSYAEVAEQGAQLRRIATCLTGTASASDLALAYQYAGLAALMLKDDARAQEAFRQAAVIGDEVVPFDDALASDLSVSAVPMYAEELEAAKAQGYGMLSFCQPASLYGLQFAKKAQWQALEGQHLVQQVTEDGAVPGFWIDVKAANDNGVLCEDKVRGPLKPLTMALLGGGGIALAGGGVAIGTTSAWWSKHEGDYVLYGDSPFYTSIESQVDDGEQGFKRMRTLNIAGGVLALAGTGLLAAGGVQLWVTPLESNSGWMVGSAWEW